MKQYCRYCGFACLQEDTLFYCSAKDEIFNSEKAKRPNKCKHFGFVDMDLFDPNRKYKPQEREPRVLSGQISLFTE